MELQLTITETPNGLAVSYDGSAPIPLKRGYAEASLMNLFLALRSGGSQSKVLRPHIVEHQSLPQGNCPFCKLEGRILAGMGRHRPAETKYAARVPQPGKADLAAITKVFEAGDTAAKVAAREAKIKADLESEAIGIAVAGLATRRQTKVELDF